MAKVPIPLYRKAPLIQSCIRKPSLVLGLVPPALNRKSISPLLTAAGREKLLILAADL
eukprot:SAG25_NODE_862_length_5023_cov_2.854010_7_plen_58_part_00